jgi:hypothetical protein
MMWMQCQMQVPLKRAVPIFKIGNCTLFPIFETKKVEWIFYWMIQKLNWSFRRF